MWVSKGEFYFFVTHSFFIMSLIVTQREHLSAELERALEQMNTQPDTQMVLDVREDSITISPVQMGVPDEKLSVIMDEMDEQYGPVFQSLAR